MSIDPIGIQLSGSLAGFAEGYGTELTQLGYAPASVRLQMKVLADLSDWLWSHGMAAADLRRSDQRLRRASKHPPTPAEADGESRDGADGRAL